MEWRCEWCGKPHDEDDPPCDNCGHGSFERAVVPVANAEESLGSEAKVWVCTACGREHTKHSPPCSRCGNGKLERQRQEVDEDELAVPGYVDLITPRYVLGAVVVLALAGVFVLGTTGLVDVPGFGGGVPGVSDVPGDAEAAGNVSFGDAEQAYLSRLNDARGAASVSTLSRSGDLDSVAAFLNQKRVKDEAVSREERDRVQSVLEGACETSPRVVTTTLRQGTFASASSLGDALVGSSVQNGEANAVEGTQTGFDLHATPDGRVHLLQVVC
ncbi:MAG: ribosomal protein L37E [Natronomonas sp.]|jgi:ribosomal protein L37E